MTEPRPLVSIILPAYNEEALLENHVIQICDYLQDLDHQYEWELLIINDGSKDRTSEIANSLAERYSYITALHHPRNFGLGQVLKFGFANARGDYVVTLDIDLSYDVEHIGELLSKIRETHGKIVLASPYMQGGSIKNVPWLRRILSIAGNKFLSLFAHGGLSTLTSMVRVYDGPFIRSLDLRSMGMDIMPEMLYKAMVVHAKIDEAPGRLDWGPQLQYEQSRTSSLRLLQQVNSTVVSGFMFRPFLFFVLPGLLVGLFSLYANFWMIAHFLDAIQTLTESGVDFSYSDAFAVSYKNFPHTVIIALMSAMLAVQLAGLGMIALQNKRYFDDLFHLSSTELRKLKRSGQNKRD